MMARVLVLDVTHGFHEAECLELEDFYRELRCDTFDIATRRIGGKYFDIFVDDNGLFVEEPIPTALDDKLNPVLVGNLVFANHDEEGNTTSLTDEDVEKIKSSQVLLMNEKRAWLAITGVQY